MSPEGKKASLHTIWTALLVCVGCYVGASFGMALQFPQIGAAVLFAPYAVLTAALIISPPRRWWVYFLAAALGDFWPHRGDGTAVSFVVLAEVANVARAVVTAWGVRRFGDSAGRFDTLGGMAAFLLFASVLG